MSKNIVIAGVTILAVFTVSAASAQQRTGRVIDESNGEPLGGVTIKGHSRSWAIVSDSSGNFSIDMPDDTLFFSAAGFIELRFVAKGRAVLLVRMVPLERELDAIVVSGTMRPVRKLESPISVEVYTPQFLKKNPAPSLFESLQNVNGVRPQLNCSVCNTGDIHINGLEGPYTMVTIDGMPIVSSLASVYGLFGIPTQLIDRVEIIKGPASGLYGSEAIGGLINVITKSTDKAPLFTANMMTTSWLEHTIDIGGRFRLNKKITALSGIDYYNYQRTADRNDDQFTDVTLQHRISFFNKFSLARKNSRVATLGARYFYEDRWGGDMRWTKQFRGSDSIYGESIYTSRWELIGNYQLPVHEKMYFSFSATGHRQDSYYGTIPYMGRQKIVFSQLNWDRSWGMSHNLLAGAVLRYSSYDDNTTATVDTSTGRNRPDRSAVPGFYVQDEWKLSEKQLLLLGLRYDWHPVHKSIFTPRFAWKWSLAKKQVLRLNAGTGFRIVSLFTEDHAALTGARAVEIRESLRPETSYNANVNYTNQLQWNRNSLNLDVSAWYSHFNNRIIPDYDTDPNKIIYQNLKGYSSSTGITANIEWNLGRKWKSLAGVTVQDVKKVEKDAQGKAHRQELMLTEKWSGTWAFTYHFPAAGLTLDYTGNIYGPMRLPLLSDKDPRPSSSPVWSIQNIQITRLVNRRLELFGGIKNLLDWTPAKNTPFIIARAHDPFDRKVQYDPSGKIMSTPENPYALSFDPSYVYAPNQGLRLFAGARFTVRK